MPKNALLVSLRVKIWHPLKLSSELRVNKLNCKIASYWNYIIKSQLIKYILNKNLRP